MNGSLIKNFKDFFGTIRKLKIGDRVDVEVKRGTSIFKTVVIVQGYKIPKVHLSMLPVTSTLQQKMWESWNNYK
jgi:hypothetical protein